VQAGGYPGLPQITFNSIDLVTQPVTHLAEEMTRIAAASYIQELDDAIIAGLRADAKKGGAE
jgi:hypothetical protein